MTVCWIKFFVFKFIQHIFTTQVFWAQCMHVFQNNIFLIFCVILDVLQIKARNRSDYEICFDHNLIASYGYKWIQMDFSYGLISNKVTGLKSKLYNQFNICTYDSSVYADFKCSNSLKLPHTQILVPHKFYNMETAQFSSCAFRSV